MDLVKGRPDRRFSGCFGTVDEDAWHAVTEAVIACRCAHHTVLHEGDGGAERDKPQSGAVGKWAGTVSPAKPNPFTVRTLTEYQLRFAVIGFADADICLLLVVADTYGYAR